jgi:maltooligosyltrehalose trehalohydrolase
MDRSQRAGGAHWDPKATTFVVWTTTAHDVEVRILDDQDRPERTERLRSTEPATRYEGAIDGVPVGAKYEILLDGEAVPDPFARFLPDGVHGPAQVVPRGEGAPLAHPPRDWILYELHVGTFTPEGTFRGAIAKLDHLRELGVTAIELMPVAAFAGHHGWGYDGVALYAPHAPYGSPDDLRALVAAAHERGLAVVLDVVYNHFGPSGNYLSRYAPQYFTEHVKTLWGAGPDFTWPPMRRLVVDNARYWLEEYGFDGLRLDATHAIQDASEKHVLTEIADLVRSMGRAVFFEDERDEKTILDAHGATGVWADALHHHLHVVLTGERDGYYARYEPTLDALASYIGAAADARFVTCTQNHDQIGNRATGDRLSALVDLDAFVAASAVLLFLPGSPLLFMGQEWGASTPFLYFSDHEGELGKAVSEGRRKEFEHFESFRDPPDPQARETFERSRLDWKELNEPKHARVLAAHRELLRLRREDPELLSDRVEPRVEGDLLTIRRGARTLLVRLGTSDAPLPVPPEAEVLFRSPRAAIITSVSERRGTR